MYDWNMDDVIVAEGRMCSTDPQEKVNNIPIGPNAALLKVEKVVKKDAYLWRPTPEMYLMDNALHEYVVWPIPKIQMSSPRSRRASPKASSPASVSCSIDNSSSGSKKQKCKLLDCGNSGDIVAEGRVASTNTEERIHFVPLGPNASKVWVEVIKIGKAKVWRPNSEVECVADALGTTVAWPNEKLIFL